MIRDIEEFVPRQKDRVKIFTCGPSTYRRPHIGNYRTFLYEDILQKYLEYLGYSVERIIVFTDVEDKTIGEAEKKRKTIQTITEEVARQFYADAEQLKLKIPDTIPRATSSIETAVSIIQELVRKGYAYEHDGDYFFDPLKFDDFGKLYGLDMSKWPKKKVRFRQDTYEGNRWNLGDFILWHGRKHMDHTGDDAVWDTEIGKGRPSWNVQDPAMVIKHLGPRIDINCGGIDNLYRHHDYNIAIVESYSGDTYANYYMHGEHLLVDGEKMSKSRGNILYVDDVTASGFSRQDLRFFLSAAQHYRNKLNYTKASMKEAAERLADCRQRITRLKNLTNRNGRESSLMERLAEKLSRDFEAHMDDDLSVGKAFDGIVRNLKDIERFSPHHPLGKNQAEDIADKLTKIDTVMGILY